MEKIKYDYSKLRGRIREYFGTIENFAESLGISDTAVYNRLGDKKNTGFSQDEMFYMIQRLNIRPEEIIDVFFKEKVE